jgi:hypothetical protein
MTAEAKQCPRCGSAYAGGFYYECGSSESTGKWFDESIYCLRAQISALTARVAELEGERERLRAGVKDLAGKFAYGAKTAHEAAARAAYEDATNEVFDMMHALAPPEPQPSKEGK